MKWLLALAAALTLAACGRTIQSQVGELSLDLPAQWTAAAAGPAEDTAAWWEAFGDSAAALVDEALVHNYDLRTAAASVAAARAQAKIAGAPLWPQVTAGVSANRNRRRFIGLPIPDAGGVASSTSTAYTANLVVGWEVDLWGRLRSSRGTALADLQAAEADWHGARQSLAAQTLRLYFAAVEAARQVELAESTVGSYALSTEQVESRYRRGLRPSLDLLLARSSLSTAEANLHARRLQLDSARRQLEILLGRYPSGTIATNRELPALSQPVPGGLPADLIARRPDLIAAERRLAASRGRQEEVRAALYPRISLTASGGRSSSELRNLLDGNFAVWNLVGNITQPLLQFGRMRASVDLADAQGDQALATYAGSALRAYAEVESNLAAGITLDRQEQAVADAARQAATARVQAEKRYDKGLADLLTMLTSQRSVYDAESRLLSIRRQRLTSRIDLHLALGGSFAGDPAAVATGEPR